MPTATTLASDICPASSTKRWSSDSSIPGRANSHAVPATSCTSPAASADSTVFESLTAVTSGWAQPAPSMLCIAVMTTLRFAAARITSSRRFVMTAWLLAVMPTRLPATIEIDDGVRPT